MRGMEGYTLEPFDWETHGALLWEEYYGDPDRALRIGHGAPADQRAFRGFLQARLARSWAELQVLRNSRGVPVGFGFLHDLRPTSCSLSIAVFRKGWGSGAGVLLGVKMLQHIFASYRVDRVFQWVFDTNRPSLALHRNAQRRGLLQYHGFLPDQYVREGKAHGTHVFSLTRESFRRDWGAWAARWNIPWEVPREPNQQEVDRT